MRHKTTYLILAVIGVFVLSFQSCEKDQASLHSLVEYCGVYVPTYDQDILPLFETYCSTGQGPGTGCHDAWILEYNSAMNQVENGNMMRVVVQNRTMPKLPNNFGITEMTEQEIRLLECWILNNAPEN